MKNDDSLYEEFEQAQGDLVAHRTLDRVSRLAKARSKVDRDDPRYIAAMNRVFDCSGT
jgi:hypothetical protein